MSRPATPVKGQQTDEGERLASNILFGLRAYFDTAKQADERLRSEGEAAHDEVWASACEHWLRDPVRNIAGARVEAADRVEQLLRKQLVPGDEALRPVKVLLTQRASRAEPARVILDSMKTSVMPIQRLAGRGRAAPLSPLALPGAKVTLRHQQRQFVQRDGASVAIDVVAELEYPIEFFLLVDVTLDESVTSVTEYVAQRTKEKGAAAAAAAAGGRSGTPSAPETPRDGSPSVTPPYTSSDVLEMTRARSALANEERQIAVARRKEAQEANEANARALELAQVKLKADTQQAEVLSRHLQAMQESQRLQAKQQQEMHLQQQTLIEQLFVRAPQHAGPSADLLALQQTVASLAAAVQAMAAARPVAPPPPPSSSAPLLAAPPPVAPAATAAAAATSIVAMPVASSAFVPLATAGEVAVDALTTSMRRQNKPLHVWLKEQLETVDKRLVPLVDFVQAYERGSETEGRTPEELVREASAIRCGTKVDGVNAGFGTLQEARAVETWSVTFSVSLLNELLAVPGAVHAQVAADVRRQRRVLARRLYELLEVARPSAGGPNKEPESTGNLARQFFGVFGWDETSTRLEHLEEALRRGDFGRATARGRQILAQPALPNDVGPQTYEVLASDHQRSQFAQAQPRVLVPSARALILQPFGAPGAPAAFAAAGSAGPFLGSVAPPRSSLARPEPTVSIAPTRLGSTSTADSPPVAASTSRSARASPVMETSVSRLGTAPRVGEARPTPLGGLYYEGPNCWKGAIARLLFHATRAVDIEPPSLTVRTLSCVDGLRETAWKLVGEAAGVADGAQDAGALLPRVLRALPAFLGGTLFHQSLADFFACGHRCPEDVEPLGALLYSGERRHWWTATYDSGVWTEHDETSSMLPQGLPPGVGRFFMWLKPRLGGAPRGRCAGCGGSATSHRVTSHSARCKKCKGTFVGECTKVPARDRAKAPGAGWCCPKCVAAQRGAGRQNRAPRRDAAAAPVQPAAGGNRPRSARAQRGAAPAAAPEPSLPAPATGIAGLPPVARTPLVDLNPRTNADALLPVEEETRVAPAAPVAQAALAADLGPPPAFWARPIFNTTALAGNAPAAAGEFAYPPSAFRTGQMVAPLLPGLVRGVLLAHLRLRPEETVPGVVESALSAAVRQRHRRALQEAIAYLAVNPAWASAPLEALLIRLLSHKASTRGWQPQTTFREACNLCGALSNLPLYSDVPHPVQLRNSAEWRAALTSWQLASQQHQPTNQAAVSRENVLAAMEQAPHEETAMTLLLMWLTAARPGCVLQLRARDLELQSDGALAVHFNAGKGVLFRGPYTVHTAVPPQLRRPFAAYLRQQQMAGGLFHPATEELPLCQRHAALLSAIRASDAELNLRAMRRGALQTMALAGESAATLMQFSGHTNERTLKRYLDWGRLFGVEMAAGSAAALHLAPRPPAGARAERC